MEIWRRGPAFWIAFVVWLIPYGVYQMLADRGDVDPPAALSVGLYAMVGLILSGWIEAWLRSRRAQETSPSAAAPTATPGSSEPRRLRWWGVVLFLLAGSVIGVLAGLILQAKDGGDADNSYVVAAEPAEPAESSHPYLTQEEVASRNESDRRILEAARARTRADHQVREQSRAWQQLAGFAAIGMVLALATLAAVRVLIPKVSQMMSDASRQRLLAAAALGALVGMLVGYMLQSPSARNDGLVEWIIGENRWFSRRGIVPDSFAWLLVGASIAALVAHLSSRRRKD